MTDLTIPQKEAHLLSEDLGSLSLGGVNGWGNLLFSTVADLQ